MKKGTAVFLSFLLVLSLVPAIVFADGGAVHGTPLSSLVAVEKILYGEEQAGALLERIEQMEMDIFGASQEGPVLLRIERINAFLESPHGDKGGLQLFLNLSEWGFTTGVNMADPLLKRLENMETILLGSPQEGNIAHRTEQIMLLVWGTTKLDIKTVDLPEASLVKVALLDTVDSGTAQVGDYVSYKVVENVMVDGRIVIPAGSAGRAKVLEVSSAKRLGRDGRLVLEFGRIASLDGSTVKLRVDERATEENKSLELAAGASMAGVILLGPVGLVGGYFVKGKDVRIEKNVEFFVETERAAKVSGFLLRGAAK